MKFKNPYTIVIIANIIAVVFFLVSATINMFNLKFSVGVVFYIFAVLNSILLGANIEKALSEKSYIEFLENIEEHRANFLKAMEIMKKEETPFTEFNGEVPFPEVKNKNEENIK
jgi:ABC-type protease/lipase transport system fused ATPase/permease subunit